MARLGVREEDLEETFVRSGGHGGQNVNKVATCVVLLHRPSGLQVKCQVSRYQGRNRELARGMLLDRLEAARRAAALAATQPPRKGTPRQTPPEPGRQATHPRRQGPAVHAQGHRRVRARRLSSVPGPRESNSLMLTLMKHLRGRSRLHRCHDGSRRKVRAVDELTQACSRPAASRSRPWRCSAATFVLLFPGTVPAPRGLTPPCVSTRPMPS